MSDSGFKLTVIKGTGPDRGRSYKVHHTVSTVGRGEEFQPDVQLGDPLVSRRHASIELTSRGYVVVDLDSMNGTKVNGRELKPGSKQLLQDGDRLEFGPDTVMQFSTLAADGRTRSTKTPPSRFVRRPDSTPPPPEIRQRPQAAASPAPPKEPAKEQFGPYGVYESLFAGEAHRVDRAVDSRTGTTVALKRVTTKLTKPARKQFLDMAQSAQSWEHAGIATVVDCGEHSGTPFFASRFVDGASVAELHRTAANRIDVRLAAYVAREACGALAYLQERDPRYVHNILGHDRFMLSRTGEVSLIGAGVPPIKTLLLGISSLDPMELRFLAPECRAERPFDSRADLFSLGIMLYELLTREPIDPRRVAVLPDVASVRPDIPPELAKITMKVIHLHPMKRFRSAAEMGEELAAASKGYGSADAAQWMSKNWGKV